MAAPTETNLSLFWEYLHAALGLQHTASYLAGQDDVEQAVLHEQQAISLLLEATCLLDPEEPALSTVRQLATAGVARLRALKPRPQASRRATGRAAPRPHTMKATERRSRPLLNARGSSSSRA